MVRWGDKCGHRWNSPHFTLRKEIRVKQIGNGGDIAEIETLVRD